MYDPLFLCRRDDLNVDGLCVVQVDAANKIMMLRKKVKEAAEDRVKIERRRDRRAEAEALRLESKLSDMAREIEDLTRESRAKRCGNPSSHSGWIVCCRTWLL